MAHKKDEKGCYLSSSTESLCQRCRGKLDLQKITRSPIRKPELDAVFGLSESESTTSSSSSDEGLFEGNGPLVLELHDLKRDPTAVIPTTKQKKLRKKKKGRKKRVAHTSSSSPSDTSLKQTTDNAKEEFYDAHESYHGITPNPMVTPAPMVGVAVIQRSNQDQKIIQKLTQDPKIAQAATVPQIGPPHAAKPAR